MGVLTEVVTSPLTYLSIVFVLGFLPGFTLRVCLLLYPKGHPRRTELVGELYSLPRPHRLFFVAEQVETALFEAPRERREAKRRATALGVEDRTADVLLDEVAELLDEKSRRDGARLGRTPDLLT